MFGGDDYYPHYSEIPCGPADSRRPPVSLITFMLGSKRSDLRVFISKCL